MRFTTRPAARGPRRRGVATFAAPQASWQAILDLADSLEPGLRHAFLTAVDTIAASLALGELTEATALSAIEQLLATFSVDILSAPIGLAVSQGLTAAVAGGATVAGATFELAFGVPQATVALAARQRAARLVTAVDASTRQSIRAIVAEAGRTGRGPRDILTLIRGVVGLHPRQALALDRYAQGLVGKVTPNRAASLTAQYRNRLIRERAETIARTELLDAANHGQQLAWEQAAREGLISPDVERVWVVTHDDKLCPICAPLDGVSARLDAPFMTSLGAVQHPPAHPRCRCALSLRT